jgi:putative NIF3 family GTP cyclohydrolase 1 type 2
MTLEMFARTVKQALGAPGLRIVGDPGKPVAKVAVCGGSGAFLLADACFKGADLLVTGDVKYHEAREAQAQGIALMDAGHFATEFPAVEGLRQVISTGLQQRGFAAEVLPFSGEREPFYFL